MHGPPVLVPASSARFGHRKRRDERHVRKYCRPEQRSALLRCLERDHQLLRFADLAGRRIQCGRQQADSLTAAASERLAASRTGNQARAEIDVRRYHIMQLRHARSSTCDDAPWSRNVIGDNRTRQRCGRMALRKHGQRTGGRACRDARGNRAAFRLGTIGLGIGPWRGEAKFGDGPLEQRLDGCLVIGVRPWRRVGFPASHGAGRYRDAKPDRLSSARDRVASCCCDRRPRACRALRSLVFPASGEAMTSYLLP